VGTDFSQKRCGNKQLEQDAASELAHLALEEKEVVIRFGAVHAARKAHLNFEWVAEQPQGDPQAGGCARLDPAQQPALRYQNQALDQQSSQGGRSPLRSGLP
jgi:hypothetical protein